MIKKNNLLIFLLFVLLSLPIATYAEQRVVIPKEVQESVDSNSAVSAVKQIADGTKHYTIMNGSDNNSLIKKEMWEIINTWRKFGIAAASLAFLGVGIYMMTHASETKGWGWFMALKIIATADICLIALPKIIDTFEWIRGALVAGGH